jgi:cytidine deaminase
MTPPTALLNAAIAAREHAHAPYSGFRVGAALEGNDNSLTVGCNVESASYGLTICAERVAIVAAISLGRRAFTRIAIAADTVRLTPPCGACRQLLWEFLPDGEVWLTNLHGAVQYTTVAELLPNGFDASLLKPS